MLTQTHTVGGRQATIRIPETRRELEELTAWLTNHPNQPVAVDTETTGLDIYSPSFKVRTVQLGIGLEAWVLRTEALEITTEDLQTWLDGRDLIMHNAAYDVLAIRQFFGLELDWEHITDTRILSHLVDSRSSREGGVGQHLQELTAAYLDHKVAEEVKGSIAAMAKEAGLSQGEVFAHIDDTNPTYLLYAGMDVILTYGIKNILEPLVPNPSKPLIRIEHELARISAEMQHTGFLLDNRYSQQLSQQLQETQETWEAVAYTEYGTESVNANQQVAEDLQQSGVKLTERTSTGAYKLDKTILEPLAEQGHLLAIAVLEAKKAKKWRTSWVDKFLETQDNNHRCHAFINPLMARTARMSITGIPAQTLPSSDWTIRRCFIAEPGNTIISCDYQAQELRVLAALSQDENMMRAFKEGADLHQITADASGVDRSVGKTVNFAYVYGSGPANIAKTCGISLNKAKEVIQGFEKTYPRVKQLADKLQAQARREGQITTPSGRVLKVDQDRPYAALNYMIQSTSRDITAAALMRLDNEGLTPYLRLPVHDEIIASVPSEQAEEYAQRIARIMETTFHGVQITTDADILGPSWGSGYVSEEEREAYEATL